VNLPFTGGGGSVIVVGTSFNRGLGPQFGLQLLMSEVPLAGGPRWRSRWDHEILVTTLVPFAAVV